MKELSPELSKLIFNNVYNGIYLVDSQGKTLWVNKAFEEMSGFSLNELEGKTLYDLVNVYKYFSGSASILVLENKKPATVTYRTSKGKNFLVKGKPIFDDNGNLKYVVNTIWDLTVINYTDVVDKDTLREFKLQESDIITTSSSMNSVIDMAMKVAPTDANILITGESGVGKSLLAGLIHKMSDRKNGKFLKINCASIPETLLESELFGYESGAFTGANTRGKMGLVEAAEGGTIFLDEISELSLNVQAKVLTLIQEKEFVKVGGTKSIKSNVRIIAATNKNLYTLVNEGRFREDLYYRLNVIPINIPPLRERLDDIPILCEYFLKKFNEKYNSYKYISDSVIEYFKTYNWRGNVRELENTIERLVVTTKSNNITLSDLNQLFDEDFSGNKLNFDEQIALFEKNILLKAKKKFGSTRQIAKHLNLSQTKVVRLLKKHKIV
ncbi:MAG: sigma 54-interacting transcriptional regulator [Deferribacterales bacterium]|jgi:PAS domain S-box-containing protein|uniref:sigma-54 interaction domain-containing protein n=1 Tax=Deferrivibrio essentukiensis TaxID=2880922 RepID=UPI0019B31BB4|nr:sigma 54-interacting transcriptional regulator [Deferrivibrio essentukiensis]MBC7196070.1 sigma 54-interacting transcriptional regulator [Deferribacterales bacterium]MCB4204789.1 sigma 54-interacting transcriptional regulator [Deferrivibrio essentukiensis]